MHSLIFSHTLSRKSTHTHTYTHTHNHTHTLIDRVWSSSLDFSEHLPTSTVSAVYLPPSLLGKSCFSPTLLWPKGQAAASGAVSESLFSKSCCVITGAVTRKRGGKKEASSVKHVQVSIKFICIATARQWRDLRLMRPSCGLVTVAMLVPGRCWEAPQTKSSLKVPFVMPNGARVLRAALASFVLFGISLKETENVQA